MRTPQLFFEQIFLHEKTTDQFPENRKVELDDRLVSRELDIIEKSNAEILSAYSADAMREAVMRKMMASDSRQAGIGNVAERAAGSASEKQSRPPLRFRTVVSMAAAAACLAFAVFVAIPRNDGTTGNSGLLASAERAKGDGPRLFIYLKDGNKAVELDNNAQVGEGDILQMSYIAAGQTYGAILSIDGNGTVTYHYPESGPTSGMLDDSGEIPLDFAYQLDDAPGFERFFFITGTKPFTTAAFSENIRMRSRVGDLQTADLSKIIPFGTRLTELTLLK